MLDFLELLTVVLLFYCEAEVCKNIFDCKVFSFIDYVNIYIFDSNKERVAEFANDFLDCLENCVEKGYERGKIYDGVMVFR